MSNENKNKMKTLFLESKSGKVEIIYNFELITRTVKLNGAQIDYQEFTSANFLELDLIKIQTNNPTK